MNEFKRFPEIWESYNKVVSKYKMAIGLYNEDFNILLNEAEKIKPGGNYVEIGVSHGFSLIAVAMFRPDINCYGVEIEIGIKKGHEIIEDNKIKNIELMLGRGAEEVCKEWDKEIDLLFIDAEHYFENLFYDYVGWMPFVKEGHKILFHDYEAPEEGKFDVGKAMQIFKNHPKYELWIPSVDDMISSSMSVLTKK